MDLEEALNLAKLLSVETRKSYCIRRLDGQRDGSEYIVMPRYADGFEGFVADNGAQAIGSLVQIVDP